MFRAPSFGNMPHLLSMVDNIGYEPDKLARFLDLSPRTIRSYIQDGQAPRPVMYALFWETSWGMAAADAAAINQARGHAWENQHLKRRIAALEHQVLLLESERKNPELACNAPVFDAQKTYEVERRRQLGAFEMSPKRSVF